MLTDEMSRELAILTLNRILDYKTDKLDKRDLRLYRD